MEIKTLSSALVLSLLAVGPAAMAMEEGLDGDSKNGIVVQPAPTQDLEQQVQSPIVAPQNVVATPEDESLWSIWNVFGWGTKTLTTPAQEKEVINTEMPSTLGEEQVSTPPVAAQVLQTEVTPELAVEKEEVSTSAPASTPQPEIKAEEPKGWFAGWFSSKPAAAQEKVEEQAPPPPVATETEATPISPSILTQSVIPQEGDDLDAIREKARKLFRRADDALAAGNEAKGNK